MHTPLSRYSTRAILTLITLSVTVASGCTVLGEESASEEELCQAADEHIAACADIPEFKSASCNADRAKSALSQSCEALYSPDFGNADATDPRPHQLGGGEFYVCTPELFNVIGDCGPVVWDVAAAIASGNTWEQIKAGIGAAFGGGGWDCISSAWDLYWCHSDYYSAGYWCRSDCSDGNGLICG